MASRIVSSRPPHAFVLTDGSGVPADAVQEQERERQRDAASRWRARRRGDETAQRRRRTPTEHERGVERRARRAGTMPSGETSTSAASMSWQAASVMASARVDLPVDARREAGEHREDREAEPDAPRLVGRDTGRSGRGAGCSVTTLQRASVSAHWPIWSSSQTSAAPTSTVMSAVRPSWRTGSGAARPAGRRRVIGGGSVVGGRLARVIARAPGRGGCRGS